ncbi:Uncharacterised protein [Neisseria zoodegmatis]|uniref:Uncharacterized protein n=1 Tax=Neisseria zoodegmatis TaxID=326523 RepID=A0A378WGF1_9NEIS|nr:Uncharacterised protein [Neisseria zoodegmatis]
MEMIKMQTIIHDLTCVSDGIQCSYHVAEFQKLIRAVFDTWKALFTQLTQLTFRRP